jgi:NAD(P)-dependent dehydrogenase (short-subunit alcohol dehydrogenase family)
MGSTEFDLDGEIVVLTGAAGILGRRFTDTLVRHGARIALLDKDAARASELAARYGERVRPYAVDVTDRGSLAECARDIERDIGRPSVLVNAAAAKSAHFFDPFETYSLDDWNFVLRVNCTGAMLACQVFGTQMASRGRGSIINILSVYGIVAPDKRIYEGSFYGGRSINTPAVYSASKAALWGLTRYLATYWANKGVRVNALTPGGVFSGQNDTFVTQYSLRVPMRRMAEADELCGALVFLASRASSYVTGQNVVVDGGLSAW